jgi:hypothetical protein
MTIKAMARSDVQTSEGAITSSKEGMTQGESG